MGRRANRLRRAEHVPLRSASVTRCETGADGEWLVRNVSASAKRYRCPGCDQQIVEGTGHVVAWPAADYGSVADRRHWHTACWSARSRRRPGYRR
jgi:hypothetical protein